MSDLASTCHNTHNLTSYDSSYLELALRLEAKIATLDKELLSSCGIANIESVI